VTVELLVIVNYYLSGHSKSAYYVLPEEPFNTAAAILTRGFASIHFVKYSTATTTNLYLPCAIVRGPTMSMPHLCNGHDGMMS
jgi:hypothetical protein